MGNRNRVARAAALLHSLSLLALALLPSCVLPPAQDDEAAPGLVTFTADPELVDIVAEAAARWSAATGVEIRVAEAGIPVSVVPQVVNDDGDEADGVTYIDGCLAQNIDISARTRDVHGTVLHEMGHALSRPCDMAAGHSETGIMKAVFSDRIIDAASLALVCAGLHCEHFRPELR